MRKRLALYVFIDAFGYEIYRRYGFMSAHNLNVRKLRTVFGFSSAADPSIFTGRYPDEHGHWSSFFYSPDSSPFRILKLLSFLPPAIFERGRVRHWISLLLRRFYGFTGYFEIYSVPFSRLPFFDYLEKRDYFVPGGILNTDTIFDYCTERNIPYHVSDWRKSEEESVQSALDVIEEGEARFLYLYLPKLDAVMHQYGPVHSVVNEKIRSLEGMVETVLSKAKVNYDDVSLYVISDHGMKETEETVDLITMVEKLGYRFGDDFVAMYDSTMARFWFMKEGVRERVEALLSGVSGGAVVTDDELRELRAYFKNYRFGELIFLMHPGFLINPSYMGKKAMRGMHGYHPDDPDSYAMMLSNREIPESIKSITDIRKTMEKEIEGS